MPYPGSDPGPFMLGRQGLYVREIDAWIVFAFFKGTDLHSGSHPSYTQDTMDHWIKQQEALNTMWENSVNRVVLVSYPTASICNRVAPMSITPPLHFLNLGEPNTHKTHQQNFSEHSRGILGNTADLRNRLGREAVYGLANFMKHAGLHIDGGIAKLLPQMYFLGEENTKHHLLPSPIDVDNNADHVAHMRQLWAWHVTISSQYRIRMTKFAYSSVQIKHVRRAQETGAFSIMENSTGVPSRIRTSLNDDDLDLVITEVVNRLRREEKVSWNTIL